MTNINFNYDTFKNATIFGGIWIGVGASVLASRKLDSIYRANEAIREANYKDQAVHIEALKQTGLPQDVDTSIQLRERITLEQAMPSWKATQKAFIRACAFGVIGGGLMSGIGYFIGNKDFIATATGGFGAGVAASLASNSITPSQKLFDSAARFTNNMTPPGQHKAAS